MSTPTDPRSTPDTARRLDRIAKVRPVIGMEVHVELSTRSKMFTAAPSPVLTEPGGPNTLTDPVVLALPGALPTMNRAAVELSMLVGLALNCRIADRAVWDRKSYAYPDLPKAYQISQFDKPLCFDGSLDAPTMDDAGWVQPGEPTARIGIVRAHLEEDAGKLLHDRHGCSTVDLNRAGTPLLEIVTAPDMHSAHEAVAFCRLLHATCRFLGATPGDMQKGHMRFEPNINCVLTLDDGLQVATPIVEIKNLNSFRAVAGAINHELREQPGRWAQTGEEHGPAMKSTRGWDDDKETTFLQRTKEDALDYRYFPDPDLPPVDVDDAWRDRIRAHLPELPAARLARYRDELGLADRDAQAIAFDRAAADLFDAAVDASVKQSVGRGEAAKLAANLIVQTLGRIANAREEDLNTLDATPAAIAGIIALRHAGSISAAGAERLTEVMLGSDEEPAAVAEREGLLQVSDADELEAWADAVIAENKAIAQQIRDGKQQAVGRLIGAVMQKSAGRADAKTVREILLKKLS
ncbi:MAG: Asp-tRNA(Asn)/Glu-tRNA(Gln) amidotransferase subunit GatB [Planctomycetota bacterium]